MSPMRDLLLANHLNHEGDKKIANLQSELLAARAVANGAMAERDALKAERDELLIERAEAVEVHSRIMEETCPSDEYHCTCVPVLREELASLKADWKVYRDTCAQQDDEIGRLRAALETFAATDWRRVPDGDRAAIATMTTRQISERYQVSERTAQNWKHYATEA